MEQRGLLRFKARAYLGFAYIIPWMRHLRTGIALVRRAFEAAQETGDLTFAAYSCSGLITHLLASGDPLGEVQSEAENALAFVQKARFGVIVAMPNGQLSLIRTLRGLTPVFGSFNDGEFDEGRELDAQRLYEEAIQLGREHGFIQNKGLANELAGWFYAARGFETIAHAYLRNARYCYLRWGADGKVRQLERLHPHLREESAPPRSTTTIGTSVEHLDLSTVVKVSQAVSGKIVLDKLIDTLMVIAVEHAGAERGLLILPRVDELRIEAEATTSHDRVEVRLRQTAVTPSDLPESVLHYVIRTQESMTLDDASAPNQFTTDEYISQKHSRSVLCLPLVKQSKLIGVLYLENNLTPHVFTPARIAVLKLLALQAAISLENARLYTDAQQTEAYLEAAQRLSHTGSFGWRSSTGEIVWLEETYRIAGYDRATKPRLELVLQRMHPEDVAFVQETIERASRAGMDLDFEHRYVVPDGSIKHVHVVAHAVRDERGNVDSVGAVMDVTAPKRSQQALERAFQEMQALETNTDSHALAEN